MCVTDETIDNKDMMMTMGKSQDLQTCAQERRQCRRGSYEKTPVLIPVVRQGPRSSTDVMATPSRTNHILTQPPPNPHGIILFTNQIRGVEAATGLNDGPHRVSYNESGFVALSVRAFNMDHHARVRFTHALKCSWVVMFRR